MTLDGSRIAKQNCNDEWTFCLGQEADIALFLQETRIRKIRKIFEEIWWTIAQNRVITSNEPWNTETNKVDWNAPITSKHVFPKTSAKMINGTKKTKFLWSLQNSQCNYLAIRETFLLLLWLTRMKSWVLEMARCLPCYPTVLVNKKLSSSCFIIYRTQDRLKHMWTSPT